MPTFTVTASDNAFQSAFGITPTLDTFPQANENPLSSGGKWTKSGSYGGSLQLISHAVFGSASSVDTESYTAAGDLTDCEAWSEFASLPESGTAAGVFVRQDPGTVTGKSQYNAQYVPGAGIGLFYIDSTGGNNQLGTTFSVTLSAGDSIGIRAQGSTISAYYKHAAGAWTLAVSVTDTNLAHGYMGLVNQSNSGSFGNFGGGVVGLSDSILGSRHISLTDTGLTITDRISRALIDTGLTFSTTLASRRTRVLIDTGAHVADSLGNISLSDTGLTFSDTLAAQRVVPRSITDTGTTQSDTTQKVARKFITDQGATVFDTLVARVNGHNTSVTISERGLTLTDTITPTRVFFRSVGQYAPDTSLTLSDGISVTTSYGPPGDPCTIDFRRFLADMFASSDYSDWCSANPGDCATWITYKNAILAGHTPSPPVMSTDFGTALVDAGIIALDGIPPCRVLNQLKAAFTWASVAGGLGVQFTNTSTPGASGFDTWAWNFGDGNTLSGPGTNTWSPAYNYATAGTYIVTLTITGNDGATSSVSHTVTVSTFNPSTGVVNIDAVVV